MLCFLGNSKSMITDLKHLLKNKNIFYIPNASNIHVVKTLRAVPEVPSFFSLPSQGKIFMKIKNVIIYLIGGNKICNKNARRQLPTNKHASDSHLLIACG